VLEMVKKTPPLCLNLNKSSAHRVTHDVGSGFLAPERALGGEWTAVGGGGGRGPWL
jgi:hypothetical protein